MSPFPDFLRRVVVVDLETSGLVPGAHGILEIGAVPLDPGHPGTFHREVRLEWHMEWDAGAAIVHGFTREEASSHRRTTDAVAVEDLLDWLDDEVLRGIEGRAVLAGMNPRFDRDHLAHVADRADLGARFAGLVSHRTLDLHTLAVCHFWRNLAYEPQMFPRGLDSLRTDAIYGLLGLPPETRPHRALEGARREAEAFRLLLLSPFPNAISNTIHRQSTSEPESLGTATPHHLNPSVA